jgi:hypothetical protein
MMSKTKKNKTQKIKKSNADNIVDVKGSNSIAVYSMEDYNSNDGMLTSVWGPGMWHFLHTMSFNYPVFPTETNKTQYRDFVLNLQYILPCGKCRKNLKKNFAKLPLDMKYMHSRDTFSKYLYELHEIINKMLGKTSGLTYDVIRERYEHFRARCKPTVNKTQKKVHFKKKIAIINEKGCTEPLYGKKSKCVLKIVPEETKCETFQMDKTCEKKRKGHLTPYYEKKD